MVLFFLFCRFVFVYFSFVAMGVTPDDKRERHQLTLRLAARLIELFPEVDQESLLPIQPGAETDDVSADGFSPYISLAICSAISLMKRFARAVTRLLCFN